MCGQLHPDQAVAAHDETKTQHFNGRNEINCGRIVCNALAKHSQKLIRLQKVNCFQIAMLEEIKYILFCRDISMLLPLLPHELHTDRHSLTSYAIKNLYQVGANIFPRNKQRMLFICFSSSLQVHITIQQPTPYTRLWYRTHTIARSDRVKCGV